MDMPAAVPLSLYVHYPWCLSKCPYCDFNSHEVRASDDRDAYFTRLKADIRQQAEFAQGRALTSVYIGGGTPSLMQPAEVASLLAEIDRHLGCPAEITLEANPGTFEKDRFTGFHAAGVTRLSIGAQSFQDSKLRSLGRVHDAGEVVRAADMAMQLFAHVNIDLMYGLPGQSVDEALDDLQRAIAAGVSHVSWYQLTLEPRTQFYRYPPRLPDEAHLLSMETAGLELLAQAGFKRYEISAFARCGHLCRHNINYWQFGDYLGVGAGAHGKLTTPRGPLRSEYCRQPRLYTGSGDDRYRVAPIAEESLPVEFMMNALRLIDGVEESLFERHTGLGLSHIAGTLDALRERGLLRPSHLGLTGRGLRFLDSVVAEFV